MYQWYQVDNYALKATILQIQRYFGRGEDIQTFVSYYRYCIQNVNILSEKNNVKL